MVPHQLSNHGRRIAAARRTFQRIGRDLLAESKAAIVADEKDGEATRGRNLLSLFVRANTANDLPESQRMSDVDVLARPYKLSAESGAYY